MIVDHCQRFTFGRESRRPAGELIRPSEYDVYPIDDVEVAKAFIRTHHYIKHSSPAPHRFGLARRGVHVGTALFGPACSTNAHEKVWGDTVLTQKTAVTFGRLVMVEEVPGNGESYFIARCHELLARKGVRAVETCADPEPRTNERGEQTFKGHLGIVYQATNYVFIGKTNDSTNYLLPDGTVLSQRSQSKLRAGERGDNHPIDQLVAFGAAPLEPDEDAAAWLSYWREHLCRRRRHRGNYRYIRVLDKRCRREVLARHESFSYPKFDY